MIPATLAALADRRLHRRDLIVYGLSLQELDIAQHRTMKLAVLAKQTGMRESHVSRSLRRLAQLGYLERGPLEDKRRTYRLTYSTPLPTMVTSQVA